MKVQPCTDFEFSDMHVLPKGPWPMGGHAWIVPPSRPSLSVTHVTASVCAVTYVTPSACGRRRRTGARELQMAEVAVPRRLFAEVLWPIGRRVPGSLSRRGVRRISTF